MGRRLAAAKKNKAVQGGFPKTPESYINSFMVPEKWQDVLYHREDTQINVVGAYEDYHKGHALSCADAAQWIIIARRKVGSRLPEKQIDTIAICVLGLIAIIKYIISVSLYGIIVYF